MDLRALAVLPLAAALLTGCSEAQETVDTVRDCTGLAADVARSGLASTPTRAEAEEAVRRLDDRVESLDSPEVRDAATDLRDRLRELQEAARANDAAAVRQAADRARTAAREAAAACNLPVDQFLG